MGRSKTLYRKGDLVIEHFRCGVVIYRPKHGRTRTTYMYSDPTKTGWTEIAVRPW